MIRPERIRLRDLRLLTAEEHQRAKQICTEIRKLVEARDAYVKHHNLNPEIADPGANWAKDAENAIHNLYNLVVQGDYPVLNRLRFYTQPFTGYQLAAMAMGFRKMPIPDLNDAFDDHLEKIAPLPDHWYERYKLITRHVSPELRIRYPRMMGEIGWEADGIPVNHDVFSYQERFNMLYESGLISHLQNKASKGQKITILEIGGGYGGLAFALAQSLGNNFNYLICDLPESLLFSAVYLGLTCPKQKHTIYSGTNLSKKASEEACHFTYIPNYMFDEIARSGIRVDLAINTLSLAEMTEAQVRYYSNHVKDMIGSHGVFFEQNHDGRWLGLLDCKPIIGEYFPHRLKLSPKTLPVLSKGKIDLWSNAPLVSILSARSPLSTTDHFKLFFWRLYWLVRKPELGISKFRELLQNFLSPGLFSTVKRIWNKLGGQLPS